MAPRPANRRLERRSPRMPKQPTARAEQAKTADNATMPTPIAPTRSRRIPRKTTRGRTPCWPRGASRRSGANSTRPASSLTRGAAAALNRAPELAALGKKFHSFKLTPKHYDEIVRRPREALEEVRRHERALIDICLREARVPRDLFRKVFVGKEISVTWLNRLIKADERYSAVLAERKPTSCAFRRSSRPFALAPACR